MSAICGIIQLDGRPVNPDALKAMARTSAARGPDGVRYWLDGCAGFVHLAMHVTPESVHEQQPLVSSDGRLVLVCDARIDNRDELIAGLGGARAFADDIITEPALLLRAFQRWGRRCVERLLGDFVLAVWDRHARGLFLARDPLGGHSLSYHRRADRVVFASETAAIADLPGFTLEIDEDTVTRALARLPTDTEATHFKGICYVPPAHRLTMKQEGVQKTRYWEPDPDRRFRYHRDDEYTDHFLALLDQAVGCRLRSIGPVAISLSGGNDSTLVAACAARLLPELNPDNPRLRSFSYVFDEYPECDERRFIEPVVASYDIDACYIPADDKWSFADLGRRPVRWDYLWTSCYAQLPIAVAEATRQAGCRTLLNGDYGDALFSGASYFAADLLYSGQLGALLALARQIPRGQRRQTLFDHGLRLLIPERLKRIYRSARRRPWVPKLPGLSARRLREAQRIREAARLPTSCAALSPGRRPRCASLLEASWPNAQGAARAGLHAPMAVESCSPYFDRRLVEFVLAVPQEQIAVPGRWRRLQRAAMRRLLPAEVVERTSKTRYGALLRAGLGDKAREKAVNLLEAPLAVEHDWIDASWLTAALAFRRPTDNDLYALSQCLHLELWLRALQDHTGARSSP